MYMLTGFRITPAGAGKTATQPPFQSRYRDHPRRCGENLMRAKKRLRSPRITPAGAGKTILLSFDFLSNKDHPRRCGENMPAKLSPNGLTGSPPQVRGKLIACKYILMNSWITPAGAGKTINPPIQTTNDQDHPRRCGENMLSKHLNCIVKGSPPQVRGKR